MVMFFSIAFSACETHYEISLATEEVTIYSNLDNEAILQINVSGGQDTPRVYGYASNLISVSDVQKISDGSFKVSISANDNVYDEVTQLYISYPNADPKSVKINIVSTLDSAEIKNTTPSPLLLEAGKTTQLYASNYLNILPMTTSYEQAWSLKEDYTGVTLEDNEIYISDDFSGENIILNVTISQDLIDSNGVTSAKSIDKEITFKVISSDIISVYEDNSLESEFDYENSSLSLPRNTGRSSQYVYVKLNTAESGYSVVKSVISGEGVEVNQKSILSNTNYIVYVYEISAVENVYSANNIVRFSLSSTAYDVENVFYKDILVSTYDVPTTFTLENSTGEILPQTVTNAGIVYTSYIGTLGYAIKPRLSPTTNVSNLSYILKITNITITENVNLNDYLKISYKNANGLTVTLRLEYKSEFLAYVPVDESSNLVLLSQGTTIYLLGDEQADGCKFKLTFTADANDEAVTSTYIIVQKSVDISEVEASIFDNLDTKEGISEIETSSINSKALYLSLKDVNLSGITLLISDDNLSFSYDIQDDLLVLQLYNLCGYENDGLIITLVHDNGSSKVISLKFYVELDDSTILLSYSASTQVLHYSNSVGGQISGFSIATNHNSKVVFLTSSNSKLTKITYFFSSNIIADFEGVNFTDEIQDPSYFYLQNNNLTTFSNDFSGYLYFKFNNGQDKSCYRVVYIDNYLTSNYFVGTITKTTLYTLESLSDINSDMAEAEIKITLRNDSETISHSEHREIYVNDAKINIDDPDVFYTLTISDNEDVNQDFIEIDTSSIVFDGSVISFKIFAKENGLNQVVSGKITVNLVDKYKISRDVTINFEIRNALKVEGVTWLNQPVTNDITLDLTSGLVSDRSFQIITKISNEDAFDDNLKYYYEGSGNISVSNTGVVSVNNATTVGGTGVVYILPSDMVKSLGYESIYYYKEDNGILSLQTKKLTDIANYYEELISDNCYFVNINGEKIYYKNLILKINIIAIDGLTSQTAIRVYALSDFKADTNANFSNLHYMIMQNLSLKGFEGVSFAGEIYGYTSDVTLELTSTALFKEIQTGASVHDITIIGSIDSNYNANSAIGFVAGSNYGDIYNLKIDASSSNDEVVPSKININNVNVAGVTGENYGTISNVALLGVNLTGNFVAGLVFYNYSGATITNSRVEFYTYLNGVSKFEASNNVAGLVYENYGTLSQSFVYAYPLIDDYNSQITSGIVYSLAYSNSGKIIECFASIASEKLYNENVNNGEIIDSYCLYKNVQGCFAKYAKSKSEISEMAVESLEVKLLEYVRQEDYLQELNLNLENLNYGFFVDESTFVLPYLSVVGGAYNTALINELALRNTYTLSSLFGIDSSAYSLSVNSDYSSYIDALTTSFTLLRSSNGQAITLTISSKQNYTKSVALNLIISNYISSLVPIADGRDLVGGEIILVQTGTDIVLATKMENMLYVGANAYTLNTENYSLNFNLSYEGESVTSDMVSLSQTDYQLVVLPRLAYDFKVEITPKFSGLGEISENISTLLTTSLTLSAYNGATAISVSDTSLNIKGNAKADILVNLQSDKSGDEIQLTASVDGVFIDSYIEDGIYKFTYNDVIVSANIYSVETNKYTVSFSIDNPVFVEQDFAILINIFASSNKNVQKNVVLNILKTDVSSIYVGAYAYKSRTYSSGTYSYLYDDKESSSFSSGTSFLLAIDVLPEYANFAKLRVTLQDIDSYINLIQLSQTGNSFEFTQKANMGVNTLEIEQAKNYIAYYIQVIVPSSVKENTKLNFYIEFLDEYSNVTKSFSYACGIEVVGQAELKLCDSETNLVTKGSSFDLAITLDKETMLYSDKVGIANVESGSMSVTPLSIVEEDGGTITYKATLTISVRAKLLGGASSGAFRLSATTYRVINGVAQTKTSTLTLYLVDFIVSDDVVVNDSTIDSSTGYDVYTGFLSQSSVLDFKYSVTPKNYSYDQYLSDDLEAVNKLLEKQSQFQADGTYKDENSGYYINYKRNQDGSYSELSLKERLYYVQNGQLISIYSTVTNKFTINDYFTFSENDYGQLLVTGKLSGSITLCLRTYIYIQGAQVSYNDYYFTIKISVYLDDENAVFIDSSEKFITYFTESEKAENYILTSDIVLEDYEVIANTNLITSLDGNGYTIYIKSFAEQSAQYLEYALFGEVSSDTLLKNLIVNVYGGGNITVNISESQELNLAGLTITNQGTIYNCHVVSFYNSNVHIAKAQSGLNVSFVSGTGFDSTYLDSFDDMTANVAGLAITNNGVITNSRVGGSEVKRIVSQASTNTYFVRATSLDVFTITSQGNVVGFVQTNNGTISSSYASNIELNNDMISTESQTAGFTIENAGTIQASYVEGVKTSDDIQNMTHTHSGSYLLGKGIVSGFAITNSGNIENSYSSISIDKEQSSQSFLASGFIYQNTVNGKVINCFSSSKVLSAVSVKLNFSGVDQYGNKMSEDSSFENCYFYNPNAETITGSNSDNTEVYYETNITEVLVDDTSKAFDLSSFYGLSFASDTSDKGVFAINTYGDVTLSSANKEAFSNRYVSYLDGSLEEYILKYSSLYDYDTNIKLDYTYGSENNPIIISDEDEFISALGGSSSTILSAYFTNTEISGNYRLISSLNFSEEENSKYANLIFPSSSRNFTGTFDGNGFSIEAIKISEDQSSSAVALGLFKSITNGVVKNLTLTIDRVQNFEVNSVGGLAGIIINSGIFAVNISNTSFDYNEYTVQGLNFAGALAGMVLGDSMLKNVNVENVTVSAEYKSASLKVISKDEILAIRSSAIAGINNLANSIFEYSYAGGVSGYVDMFTSTTRSYENFVFISNPVYEDYQVISVKVSDHVKVSSSGVSGGVFGFVGYGTYVDDISLTINEDMSTKLSTISASYYSGGVIGESYGGISGATSEYATSVQSAIDDGKYAYYTSGVSGEVGNSEIFNEKYTISVGGIIGLARSGFLYVGYNKLNVINTKLGEGNSSCIVGGVVGSIDGSDVGTYKCSVFGSVSIDLNFYMREIYVTGDVQSAKSSGGLIGLNSENTKTYLYYVNALNYLKIKVDELTGEKSYYDVNPIYSSNYGTLLHVTNGTDNGTLYVHDISSQEIKDTATFETNDSTLGIADNAGLFASEQLLNSKSFEIAPSSIIPDSGSGYAQLYSAFLGRGWQEDNWVHNEGEFYPKINHTHYNSYVYLDSYDKSIEAVYNAIRKNSSINIRLRGRTSEGSNTYKDVDLATWCNSNGITIAKYFAGWSGKMVWDEYYVTGLSETKENRVAIIVDGQIFNSSAKLYNINIIYENSDTNKQLESSLIFYNTARYATLSNCYILIKSSVILTIKDSTSSEISVGLIVNEAENCNFVKNDIVFASGTNVSFVTAEGISTDKVVNAGLFAGVVLSNPSYTIVSVTDNTITTNGTSFDVIYDTENPLNFGGYFGKIATTGNVENVGEIRISTLPIGTINLTLKNSISGDVNIGGTVGYATSSVSYTVQVHSASENSIAFNIKNTNLNITGNNISGDLHVGGIVGNTTGNYANISSNVDDANVLLNANFANYDVEGDVFIGGVAGQYGNVVVSQDTNVSFAATASINSANNLYFGTYFGMLTGGTIYAKVVSDGSYGNISINEANNVYIGGIVGQSSNAIAIFMTSDINLEQKVLKANIVYAGGLVGDGNLYGSNASVVKGMTAKQIVYASEIYTGGIVGRGSVYVSVSGNLNVTQSINGDETTPAYVGGILGYGELHSVNIISNMSCVVTQTVSASTVNVGGIVGYNTTTSEVAKISASGNTLNVTQTIICQDSLYAGGVMGSGAEISVSGQTGDSNLVINYSITSDKSDTLTSLYVGGVVGCILGSSTNASTVQNVTINMTYNLNYLSEIMYVSEVFASAGIVNVSNVTIKNGITITATGSDETIYFGIIAGEVSNITIYGDIVAKNDINITKFNTAYVGGLVGILEYDENDSSISNETTNFAPNINVTDCVNVYVGGLVAYSNSAININCYTSATMITLKYEDGYENVDNVYISGGIAYTNSTTIIFGFATSGNFNLVLPTSDSLDFANGSTELYVGGVLAYLDSSSDTTLQIDSVLTSASFISNRLDVNVTNNGSLTYGGIVGYIYDSLNVGSSISNSASVGDLKYNINSDFTFGGIVGRGGKNLEIYNCVSLVTNLNVYSNEGSSNNYGAIIGVANGASGYSNYYNSGLSLAVQDNINEEDEEGEIATFATDLPYLASGSTVNYYGYENLTNEANTTSILTEFNNLAIVKYATLFTGIAKLSPKAYSTNINSSGYYYLTADSTLDSTIAVENVFIIGNGYTINVNTFNTFKEVNLSNTIINLTYNSNVNADLIGGVFEEVENQTIFGVGVVGNVTLQGDTNVTFGGLTANFISGRIDNCYTNLNINYMAKVGGVVSSVVVGDEFTMNAYISNTYAVGEINAYSTCNMYDFVYDTNNNISTTNCYSVVVLSIYDYEKGDEGDSSSSSSINLSAKNAFTDTNVQFGFDSDVSVGSHSNWVYNTLFNYGFPTRRFGFLRNVTTYSYKDNTPYFNTDDDGLPSDEASAYVVSYSQEDYLSNYTELTWDTANTLTSFTEYYYPIYNSAILKAILKEDSNLSTYNFFMIRNLDSITTGSRKNSTIFDGCGFSINATNGGFSSSMFSENSGTIKNLSIFGVNCKASDEVVGSVANENNGVIARVNVKGSISATGSLNENAESFVGGVAGTNDGYILGCKNLISITVKRTNGKTSCVGGIVGYNAGIVVNSINANQISDISSAENVYVGGITGYSQGIVLTSSNTSAVLAGYKSSYTNVTNYAGGIVGYGETDSVITYCDNSGIVKSGNSNNESTSYAGGIVGYSKGDVSDVANNACVEALSVIYEKDDFNIEYTDTTSLYKTLNVFKDVDDYDNVTSRAELKSESKTINYQTVTCKISLKSATRLVYAYGIGYVDGTLNNYTNDENVDIDNTGKFLEKEKENEYIYEVTISNNPSESTTITLPIEIKSYNYNFNKVGGYMMKIYSITSIDTTQAPIVLAYDSLGIPTNLAFATKTDIYSKAIGHTVGDYYAYTYGFDIDGTNEIQELLYYIERTSEGIKTWSQNREGFNINGNLYNSTYNKFENFNKQFEVISGLNKVAKGINTSNGTTSEYYQNLSNNSSKTYCINGNDYYFTNDISYIQDDYYTYSISGSFSGFSTYYSNYISVSCENLVGYKILNLNSSSGAYTIEVLTNEEVGKSDIQVSYSYPMNISETTSGAVAWYDSDGYVNVYIPNGITNYDNWYVDGINVTLESVGNSIYKIGIVSHGSGVYFNSDSNYDLDYLLNNSLYQASDTSNVGLTYTIYANVTPIVSVNNEGIKDYDLGESTMSAEFDFGEVNLNVVDIVGAHETNYSYVSINVTDEVYNNYYVVLFGVGSNDICKRLEQYYFETFYNTAGNDWHIVLIPKITENALLNGVDENKTAENNVYSYEYSETTGYSMTLVNNYFDYKIMNSTGNEVGSITDSNMLNVKDDNINIISVTMDIYLTEKTEYDEWKDAQSQSTNLPKWEEVEGKVYYQIIYNYFSLLDYTYILETNDPDDNSDESGYVEYEWTISADGRVINFDNIVAYYTGLDSPYETLESVSDDGNYIIAVPSEVTEYVYNDDGTVDSDGTTYTLDRVEVTYSIVDNAYNFKELSVVSFDNCVDVEKLIGNKANLVIKYNEEGEPVGYGILSTEGMSNIAVNGTNKNLENKISQTSSEEDIDNIVLVSDLMTYTQITDKTIYGNNHVLVTSNLLSSNIINNSDSYTISNLIIINQINGKTANEIDVSSDGISNYGSIRNVDDDSITITTNESDLLTINSLDRQNPTNLGENETEAVVVSGKYAFKGYVGDAADGQNVYIYIDDSYNLQSSGSNSAGNGAVNGEVELLTFSHAGNLVTLTSVLILKCSGEDANTLILSLSSDDLKLDYVIGSAFNYLHMSNNALERDCGYQISMTFSANYINLNVAKIEGVISARGGSAFGWYDGGIFYVKYDADYENSDYLKIVHNDSYWSGSAGTKFKNVKV